MFMIGFTFTLVLCTLVYTAACTVAPHGRGVYDDVVSISEDGTALNKHGTPAMIVEYSNTPIGAIKQVRDANHVIARGIAYAWTACCRDRPFVGFA